MKNRLWYILWLTSVGATLLMGGCASEADRPLSEAEPASPISFASAMQEEQAVSGGEEADKAYAPHKADVPHAPFRARSLHDAGISGFRIFGYKNDGSEGTAYTSYQTVMDAYRITWQNGSASTTNTSGWEYVGQEEADGPAQTVKYWDYGALAYRFFGYAEAEGDEGAYTVESTSEDDAPYTAYTLSFTADATSKEAMRRTPYYSGLWFSTGNLADYPERPFGRPVQLEFLQPFVRVRFLFTFAFSDAEIDLTDKCFRPVDEERKMARKGTFRVSYPLTGTAAEANWKVTDVEETLETLTEDYYEQPADEGAGRWYDLLPQVGQGAYILTVSVNGEAKTATVPAHYMDWQPGYAYTYVFKITEEGGVVIDSVNMGFVSWTEVTRDPTLYNW